MVQFTTCCIYRIVCFVTGKCYVGQSCDPTTRNIQHFSKLRHNAHHSKKLQKAFNEYGRDKFFFEVIERNINPESISEREKYWIAVYDSHRNGYNNAPGGSIAIPPCKTFLWNSIQYPSIKAAAKANNVSIGTMYHRASRGLTSDSEMNGHKNNSSAKKRCCKWNGIEYPSIISAATAIGIDRGTLVDRLAKGFTCDADVPRSNRVYKSKNRQVKE